MLSGWTLIYVLQDSFDLDTLFIQVLTGVSLRVVPEYKLIFFFKKRMKRIYLHVQPEALQSPL